MCVWTGVKLHILHAHSSQLLEECLQTDSSWSVAPVLFLLVNPIPGQDFSYQEVANLLDVKHKANVVWDLVVHLAVPEPGCTSFKPWGMCYVMNKPPRLKSISKMDDFWKYFVMWPGKEPGWAAVAFWWGESLPNKTPLWLPTLQQLLEPHSNWAGKQPDTSVLQ